MRNTKTRILVNNHSNSPVEGTTLDLTRSDLFPTKITALSIFSCFLSVNRMVMARSKLSRSSQEYTTIKASEFFQDFTS